MNKKEILSKAKEVQKKLKDSYLEEKLQKYEENVEKKAPVNKLINQINERVIQLTNNVK